MTGASADLVVAGAGPAGVFAAIRCRELAPAARVIVLERGREPLRKVLISGGGRCNVTNVRTDPRELAQFYPRGGRELMGPFTRFGPAETVAWFARRGVELRAQPDGRYFPVTDSSRTVVDALLRAAREAGVELRPGCGLRSAARAADGGFALETDAGPLRARALLLATGGGSGNAGWTAAADLGHTVAPPVPSLFTFRCRDPRLRDLAGIAFTDAEVRLAGAKPRRRGPLLVTHDGLSGPAVLLLSAWSARELHALDYRFDVLVDWIPAVTEAAVGEALAAARRDHPRRQVRTLAPVVLPQRLWESLVDGAALPDGRIWAELTRDEAATLVDDLKRTHFSIDGQSPFKEEFVTCGGVALREVDPRTFASRLVPGLYFAGELLDVDGVTGGFNFQGCWTTGWLAGSAAASYLSGD
ncbi:MAG: NAD(P)/FAD-dependent oxidoreductase [bacterium]|nr:NAD(P)/FAD-dependent oxidoreductase [bacterium]